MGVTETGGLLSSVGPYSHGTDLLIQGLTGEMGHKPYTIVGGGDTVGYIENRRLIKMFNFVSTGGGASLDLMSGHTLPGVKVLLNR
jgi:3-phosphoglycerate kinase